MLMSSKRGGAAEDWLNLRYCLRFGFFGRKQSDSVLK